MVRRLHPLHKVSRRIYSIAHGGSVFNFAFSRHGRRPPERKRPPEWKPFRWEFPFAPPKSALGGEPEGPPPKAHHLDLYKVRGYFFVTLREKLKFAGWFCAKDREQAVHNNHHKTASPREGKPKFRTGRAFSPHPKFTNHPHPAPGSPPGHRAGRSSCPPGRYGWSGAVGESPPKRLRPVPVRSSQTPPSSLFAG